MSALVSSLRPLPCKERILGVAMAVGSKIKLCPLPSLSDRGHVISCPGFQELLLEVNVVYFL
jgi:hypothetical protein